MQQVAQKNDCIGVICGHIHTPENKMIDGVHYLNSGDWVESLTAIVEDFSGAFKVVEYSDFCREHNLMNVESPDTDLSTNQTVEA